MGRVREICCRLGDSSCKKDMLALKWKLVHSSRFDYETSIPLSKIPTDFSQSLHNII